MNPENFIGCLVFIFVILPLSGISVLIMGETLIGILCLIPLVFLIAFILYNKYVVVPAMEHQENLRRIYQLPSRLRKNEDSEMSVLRLLHTIKSAERKATDPKKKAELLHCEQVVRSMKDKKSFDDIYRAFRLTGCHIVINNHKDNNSVQVV